jgi:hypothetical protein
MQHNYLYPRVLISEDNKNDMVIAKVLNSIL